MIIGFYICISLFAVLSIFHLYFCFIENEPLRAKTKPFLMLLLGLSALFYNINEYLIYVSCFLACLGDIFLLKNKKTIFFLIGGTSFLACHVLNLIYVCLRSSLTIPLYFYILIPIYFVIFSVISILFIKKLLGTQNALGSIFYLSILSINLSLGIIACIITKNYFYLFFSLGYVLYLISDCTLAYVTFIKDIKRRDFPVMITYICAEFFIIISLLLTI